jgi:hypothetical protein
MGTTYCSTNLAQVEPTARIRDLICGHTRFGQTTTWVCDFDISSELPGPASCEAEESGQNGGIAGPFWFGSTVAMP